jgi:hypothetical protein
VLEEGEVREDSKVALTEVDKDNNLEDGIGIEMDKLNLIVMKEDLRKSQERRPNPRWKKVVSTTISLV